MKRVYIKPEIVFESFTLSTNIAGDCEPPYVTTATEGACGVPGSAPGIMLFTIGVDGSNCTFPGPADHITDDGFCYHNPSEDHNLFNS